MSVAKHEGEYWLTVKGEAENATGDRRLALSAGDTLYLVLFPGDTWYGLLRPLADPEKPVRIRLKMEAEVIDG
jgi:hypothetical protein